MPRQSDSSNPVVNAGATFEALVRLDLNNPVFQTYLLTLQKPERHAALDTLNKIRQFTWNQLYRDNGLKWEKSPASSPQRASMQSIRFESPNPSAPLRIGRVISSGF